MYIGLRFRFGDGPLFAVARRHPDGQKPWEQKRRSYPETSVHGGLHAGNDIDTQQSRQYHHRHSLKQHHRLPGHIHLSRVELRIQNGARHLHSPAVRRNHPEGDRIALSPPFRQYHRRPAARGQVGLQAAVVDTRQTGRTVQPTGREKPYEHLDGRTVGRPRNDAEPEQRREEDAHRNRRFRQYQCRRHHAAEARHHGSERGVGIQRSAQHHRGIGILPHSRLPRQHR